MNDALASRTMRVLSHRYDPAWRTAEIVFYDGDKDVLKPMTFGSLAVWLHNARGEMADSADALETLKGVAARADRGQIIFAVQGDNYVCNSFRVGK